MNLYQIRTDRNISLRKLEEITGISKSRLNYIENNVRSPTLFELAVLAIALDVRIIELFESKYK